MSNRDSPVRREKNGSHRAARLGHDMSKYLIYFNQAWVGVHAEPWWAS